ncbi:MAG: ATP-binding cassette domain-containing protein [Eggerthellaceae bacterium]|nr:ATP-binding cassette domain-containing protein [Eggerthellaceae bacterium]
MPENVNTSVLEIESELADDSSKKTMIKVDHVSMIFNMASEQLNSIKEYAIAALKRELRFKEFRALDDVSFEVKQGDVFGILGTNGSGKSTILKIIAGVLEPSKGSCTVSGNIAPLIELGAGFDMELTARENIYLNGALLGYSKQFIEENFDDIVEFAEVEKFLDMPMKNYSSGMVARIAFAIATVIVPEILIVDEVLSVGDFMFQKKCEDRITKLIKEHGVTVLIVSHNNDQIERLCNKAVWIEKGHLRMAGTSKEVCQTYRVLGGHVGSKESEQIVFETLQDLKKPDMSGIESIEADTRYGIAAKLSSRCYPDGAKAAILASGEHEMVPLIANGLAGALDAPILLTQNESVPDITAQELNRLNPQTVYVLNGGTLDVDAITKEATSSVPSASVEVLEGENVCSLSWSIFQYGEEKGLWGSDVALTYDGCLGDLVSLSPYLFSNKCPVLVKEASSEIPEWMLDAALSAKEVLVVGGYKSFTEEALEPIAKSAGQVTRFVGEGPYDANEKIDNWISQHAKAERLLVVSIWYPQDAVAVAAYASKNRGLIVLEDPQNLDSVAHGINYLKKQSGKLEFIGDKSRFNDLDKSLLAKALKCD